MKNVKMLVKLRRLMKSVTVSVIILILGIAGTAFKIEANNVIHNDKFTTENSTTDKNGFKSLFSKSIFDPSKPYVTQINPKAVRFVQDYIRSNEASLEKMKIWGKPYFDMLDGILSSYALPKELKYLSVIESDLISNAVSIAGAVGPWQIMAGEATRMGLKINSRVDERTNFNKSTHAAARILKELYSQFNDWTLVIAAYNCGAGRVRQAISKSGSKNFWTLQAYLPAETRNHVKRFISTHYIFEGSGGLTTMTALELDDYKARTDDLQTMQLLLDQNEGLKESTIKIAGKYNSAIIAKNIGIDISLFNKLNPNFNKCVSAGKTYLMKLPRGLDTVFSSKKNTILGESVQQLLNNSMAISK